MSVYAQPPNYGVGMGPQELTSSSWLVKQEPPSLFTAITTPMTSFPFMRGVANTFLVW